MEVRPTGSHRLRRCTGLSGSGVGQRIGGRKRLCGDTRMPPLTMSRKSWDSLPILTIPGSGGMKGEGGGPLPADEERLGLRVALECLEAVLPAKTALLDAAERDFGGEGEVPVHPDDTSLHP